jgi:2,5-dihydroxypyridine 5,6-dioxygenase
MAYGRMVTSVGAATELVGLFRYQLDHCSLKPGELCIVVTDTAFNPVYAASCVGAALLLGAEAYQVTLPHSHPLPARSLGSAWKEADLLVYATTHTLHYSRAMREALDAGLRALMVVQPLHVIQRLTADADVIRRTKAGAKRLGPARQVRIWSEAGTDLTMEKTGRPALAHYGVADEPGHLDFWGAGMVETAQLEGTLEGTLVLDIGDVIFHLGRYVERPVRITFREGRAVAFEGGLDAVLLKEFLESYRDEHALMAGHTSWGTDHRALWGAQAVQFPEPGAGGADTEACLGNVQIEIGSNNDVCFQGKNVSRAHLGLCLRNCSLSLDDEVIVERGAFVPSDLR